MCILGFVCVYTCSYSIKSIIALVIISAMYVYYCALYMYTPMHSYIVVRIHINSQYVSRSCASSTQRSHTAYNKHLQDIQALYAPSPKEESKL